MSSATDQDSVEQQLATVSDTLSIPTSTVQITRVRLNQLGSEPEIEDESMPIVGATTLALSAREDGLPITVSDIAEAWSETLDGSSIEPGAMTTLFDDIASHLDIDGTPPEPRALIERFGADLDLADGIVVAAKRILEDAFEADPRTIASGTSPAGTAGAVLHLAAAINDVDGADESTLGEVSETSQVTVRSRQKKLRDVLGEERLETAERYQLDPDTGTPMATTGSSGSADSGDDTESSAQPEPDEPADASTGTEGAEAETVTDGTGTGTAATSPDLTEGAVQNEVDALAEALDIGASVRLFARGMVSDAVADISVKSASELAGAALLAACRINNVDVEATEIAAAGDFQARALYEGLDLLSGAVDVDIPRLDAATYVDQLVESLDLPDAVREESHRALEQYSPRPDDPEYTDPELAAGAISFAATVGGATVGPDALADASGADPEFISDAMNSILVSLCLGLVNGRIPYDEVRWTSNLLESELSPSFGDSGTGTAIALAKTYCAGRESQHVGDTTIDVLVQD